MNRLRAASAVGKYFRTGSIGKLNEVYSRITVLPLAMLSTPICISLTLKSILTESVVRYVRPSAASLAKALK